MATTADLQAKLTEYIAAEAATKAKREVYDVKVDEETAAIAATTTARAEWVEALTALHAIDDEFDVLVASVEPPALPV